jgi:hypothetical protein
MAPLGRTRTIALLVLLAGASGAALSPGEASQPPAPPAETGQPSDLVNRPTCCMYEDLRTSYRCILEAQ